jgi:hypothetical protein
VKVEDVEGQDRKLCHGLLIHDLRRSAIKNLMKTGVNEKVAIRTSGHKTRTVFDRYLIGGSPDVMQAMRRLFGE